QSGSFDVNDQQLIGKAENDPAYKAVFTFSINNSDFTFDRPVQYKTTDPVKGEVYQPLRVVPAITGEFDEPLYVLDGAKEKQVQLELHTRKSFNDVSMHMTSGEDWKINGGIIGDPIKKDESRDVKANITTNTSSGNTEIGIAINKIIDDQNVLHTQPLMDEHAISYEHIPAIIYYTPLEAKAEKINVITKGKNIGYIIGAGDKVPQALQQMGYNVTFLHPNNITDENLKQFDAVIAGVRAYNVNAWMNSKYEVLMRYIQNGGNYIVQYNTIGFQQTKMKIGPYDFAINRTRVTDENADVHVLIPNHIALNSPNKISSHDFEGWIQERSIYQADQIDSAHYEAPLGMHDPNEPETDGSLIITKYGKGNFVYTGLVFFRELPAGIPGAYRLMANLIALPKNK
ncbi:MAG TPA: PIG-L family deacetylase, partial [Chitinophagaceae bacterium]